MSVFQKLFGDSSGTEGARLINLRCTRFRQLLRNYGRLLDLLADAAEKQGGDYILDRQYLVSLSEVVFDLAHSMVFDLNVITGQRHTAFYDTLNRFQAQARAIIADGYRPPRPPAGDDRRGGAGEHPVAPERLARAIRDAEVLFANVGQIACRGVAAGPVVNLESRDATEEFPSGAVLVARDILPDDDLIRLMKQASAILTDLGKPAGDVATLAREFRIPTIVRMGQASERLKTGTVVTVDADENTVYLGRIEELLSYYQAEHLGPEEETEYGLLRKLRRAMFPLTLGKDPEAASAGLEACKTVHDLIHLAHELSGEAICELLASRRDVKRAFTELAAGLGFAVHVVDVGDGLSRPEGGAGPAPLEAVRSVPLKTVIAGMGGGRLQGLRTGGAAISPAQMVATIKEEHANIAIIQPGGFDMVDSMIGESRESNHIYCRFATFLSSEDSRAARGALAHAVLTRLGFAAAETTGTAGAWISGFPYAEMEERLKFVGRLWVYLLDHDVRGWSEVDGPGEVEAFMAQHVQ